MNLMQSKPILGESVFVAPNASVIGDANLAEKASVWYGAVLRADKGSIRVGEGASVLERAVVNTMSGPVSIGAHAKVGASSVVSGSEVATESVVGSGCVVSGAKIGKHAMLGAGSTMEGGEVPSGELWAGAPAVFVRKLSTEEITEMVKAAQKNVVLAQAHADECGKTHEQIESEKLREELLRDRSEDYHSHLGITGQESSFIETQARIVEEDRKKQAAAGNA